MKPLLITLFLSLFLFQFGISQIGRVGINTISPAAMLHVKDSSVLFTGPVMLPGTPGNPPLTGAGSRMMWYPAKAAFRSGLVTGTQWDKVNIGNYSLAGGFNTKAEGSQSTALGNTTTASGFNSTAMGNLTTASGTNSIAMGDFTTASGTSSTAMGDFTTASGAASMAIGNVTEASGISSMSMGTQTQSIGYYSVAMGDNTDANSYASVAIGRYNDLTSISSTAWNANDPLFMIGNGASNGARSNALTVLKNGRTGINTASPSAMLHVNDGSVLFASSTTPPLVNPPISGPGSRMMWYHNKISFRAGNVDGNQWDYDSIGYYSVGIGKNVIAVGHNSTAFGSGTFASGESSTAFGLDTKASGYASMAISADTKAQGNQSFAAGWLTIANGYASTVIGILNDSIVAPQTNGYTSTTPLFIIGNGSSTNARSNALTVLKNGNIGIGTSSPGFLLNFLSTLGDKISLWGNSGAHYGFGVQSNVLQIHTDVSGSDIVFGYGTSSALTETMRIKGNGNVGIGLSSPGFPLNFPTVVGDKISLWGNSGNNFGFGIQAGVLQIHTSAVGEDVVFGFGSSVSFNETMRVKGNGNVGIGVAPTQRLHVAGNGLFTGTVTASCGVLVCSDIRYKKNILPLTNVLSGIQSLNGVYYHWDKETFPEIAFNDVRQIGIIAQELEKVFPEVVHTDASGYKTVDYSRLSPVLLEAIKEQQQIIDTQNTRLDHQQKQIDMLTTELNKLKEIFTEIGSRREQE